MATSQNGGSVRSDKGSPFSHDAPARGGEWSRGSGSRTGTQESAARSVSQVFGEVVWLMSQSPLLKQSRMFYDQDKPIGCAFWGTVSDEVEERLKSGNAKLKP